MSIAATLAGRVVIVTGAGSGLGASHLKYLADAGALRGGSRHAGNSGRGRACLRAV